MSLYKCKFKVKLIISISLCYCFRTYLGEKYKTTGSECYAWSLQSLKTVFPPWCLWFCGKHYFQKSSAWWIRLIPFIYIYSCLLKQLLNRVDSMIAEIHRLLTWRYRAIFHFATMSKVDCCRGFRKPRNLHVGYS